MRKNIQNPLMNLPAAAAIIKLPPVAKAALRAVCLDLAKDAHAKAEYCWKKRKAPMAAYYRAVGVYAGHLAKACK